MIYRSSHKSIAFAWQYSHKRKFVKYSYASRKVVTLAHSGNQGFQNCWTCLFFFIFGPNVWLSFGPAQSKATSAYRLFFFNNGISVSANIGNPDRCGVYLQCHAVYTAATLQHMQCTGSVGCSYTSDCKYTADTLLLHCGYTAGTLHSAVYTAYTLQNGLLWKHFCTLHLHCQQVYTKFI